MRYLRYVCNEKDDFVLCIKDIQPAAQFHALVLPKRHIKNCNHLGKEDTELGNSFQLLIWC